MLEIEFYLRLVLVRLGEAEFQQRENLKVKVMHRCIIILHKTHN